MDDGCRTVNMVLSVWSGTCFLRNRPRVTRDVVLSRSRRVDRGYDRLRRLFEEEVSGASRAVGDSQDDERCLALWPAAFRAGLPGCDRRCRFRWAYSSRPGSLVRNVRRRSAQNFA